MVTKTRPKKWEQESRILEAVPPAHLPPNRRPAYIIPKKERLSIVRDHLPNLSKTDKDKAADGIEAAVRKFLFAANIDDRPLPANVRARMENLEEAASNLLEELRDCDDLTWEEITRKADKSSPPVPPSSPPKSKSKPRTLSDDLYVPMRVEPMDPPDRMIQQLEQYVTLFSAKADDAGAMSNSRKGTAFRVLISELMSVWSAATGQGCMGNSAFMDFVEVVANIEPVRKIIPPVEDQRRKIQRAINSVSN